MTADRPIHRSATREENLRAEQADDLGERRGIARGIALSISFLAANGHAAAAEDLQNAILIETQEGD